MVPILILMARYLRPNWEATIVLPSAYIAILIWWWNVGIFDR